MNNNKLSDHAWVIDIVGDTHWQEVAKLIEQIDPTIRFMMGQLPTEITTIPNDFNTNTRYTRIVYGVVDYLLWAGSDYTFTRMVAPINPIKYTTSDLYSMLPGEPNIDTRKDQLRAKFRAKYPKISKITQTNINHLIYLIDNELDIHANAGGLRMHMESLDRFTSKMIRTKGVNHKGLKLTVCAHYFTGRQAVTFTEDGNVYFCGWASTSNHEPFLRAFAKWLGNI